MIAPFEITPAIVTKTDPKSRTLNVQVYGTERQIVNVFVVNDPGNYGFPKMNDSVLVLNTATRAYCVGVIQIQYEKKTERKAVKDPETNTYVRADEVDNGGICIGNITNKTKFRIENNGDFSLWSALFAGLKFESLRQILSIAGNMLDISAGTVTSYIGSVFRNVPGTGLTPFQALPPIDSTGTTGFSAVEVLFDLLYRQLRLVRFHLGHILNAAGVPEMGSIDVTKPLRALLEVCLSGATIASLKMDEGGNIEISTSIGKIVVDSSIPLGSVLLGGASATESAVYGDLLKTWLDNHVHPSSWGPTGPASAGSTGPLPDTTLSPKVKIG